MVTQASDGGRIAPVSAHAAPPADHSAAARARALICGRARRRTPRGKAPRPYGWPDHKPSSLPRRSRFPRQRNAQPNSTRIQPTRTLHRSRRAAFGRANAESVGQGQVSVLSDERQALFSLSSAWKASVLLRRLILITCPAGTRVPYDSYRHWLWLLLPRPDGGWSRAGLLRRSRETERPSSARNSWCPLLRYQPFTTGHGEVQRATRCQLRTGYGRRSRNGSAANGDACPKVPENAALSGAPGRSRTCGPRLRRPLLYPAELQARGPASAFTPQTRQAASGGAAASAEAGSPSLTPGRARSRTLRFRGQVARGSGWTDAGRGGREAEGAGLLNQYTVQSCIEGSNPSLSATARRRALSSVG